MQGSSFDGSLASLCAVAFEGSVAGAFEEFVVAGVFEVSLVVAGAAWLVAVVVVVEVELGSEE